MFEAIRKFGIAVALGTIVMASGLAGCSSMSGNHVDCNVVKLQSQSGRSDSEIASAKAIMHGWVETLSRYGR